MMIGLKIRLRVLKLRMSRLGALSLSWALLALELLSFQIGSSLAFLVAHGLWLPLRRARLNLQRRAQAQARELAEDLQVLQRVRTQTLRRERIEFILSKSSIGASNPNPNPIPEPEPEPEPELQGGEVRWPA